MSLHPSVFSLSPFPSSPLSPSLAPFSLLLSPLLSPSLCRSLSPPFLSLPISLYPLLPCLLPSPFLFLYSQPTGFMSPSPCYSVHIPVCHVCSFSVFLACQLVHPLSSCVVRDNVTACYEMSVYICKATVLETYSQVRVQPQMCVTLHAICMYMY